MVNAVRQQLSLFEAAHPGVIYSIAAGSDCKVILSEMESERHPDWAIYKTTMPTDVASDEELWETWIPDIVVEVVSPDSARRDYEEKPEEYLRFGVTEYWIIDEGKQSMMVHRRQGGRYVPRVVSVGEMYRPTTLAGLEFDVAKVFEAARKTQA
jgi:Uma2 family endonuclease